jgi:hypothetical protein
MSTETETKDAIYAEADKMWVEWSLYCENNDEDPLDLDRLDLWMEAWTSQAARIGDLEAEVERLKSSSPASLPPGAVYSKRHGGWFVPTGEQRQATGGEFAIEEGTVVAIRGAGPTAGVYVIARQCTPEELARTAGEPITHATKTLIVEAILLYGGIDEYAEAIDSGKWKIVCVPEPSPVGTDTKNVVCEETAEKGCPPSPVGTREAGESGQGLIEHLRASNARLKGLLREARPLVKFAVTRMPGSIQPYVKSCELLRSIDAALSPTEKQEPQ